MTPITPFPKPTVPSEAPHTGTFTSILGSGVARSMSEPDCFHDLGLDQVVQAVVAPWKDYELAPFFHVNLATEADVLFRQHVMRDMERPEVMSLMRAFGDRLRTMRQHLPLTTKRYNENERNSWHLDCVLMYGEAVRELHGGLGSLELHSHGLRLWHEYLATYIGGDPFSRMMTQAETLRRDLASISYAVTIDGPDVSVRLHADEPDYTVEVERSFEKFRRGAVKSYLAKESTTVGLNHIEAQVLDCVARLKPELFATLSTFRREHEAYVDGCVERFEREIHFYIGWLDYIGSVRRAGLAFTYPEVSRTRKEVIVRGGFDLALATRLQAQHQDVVANDFSLLGRQRIVVVTGPNQGGKTTFARMFGQLHWLASLGCAVPASEARLFLFDRMFSHFEREEDIRDLRGKLHDDLVRMKRILDAATPSSIVVINEIFSSTTLQDAIYLGREIFQRLEQLDLLAVCVTFLDQLAAFSPAIVSMVASIDPNDAIARSFKLERRAADGRAHALAIAEKYHVTGEWLKTRIPQ